MSPDKKWYVVHTYSGYEEKAKVSLLDRAKQKNYDERFGQIIVPITRKESVTKTGKKRITERASFPGYIVVEMILDDETIQLVKDTPRVTGFVGNAKRPRPLPDNEVMRLVSPDEAEDVESAAVVLEDKYSKGENVRVIDGPFSNFDGVVDEVRHEKAKLRVLVKIFGRETPVELDYAQVQQVEE
jgi:transcription termination/antitermination protein NusG